MDTITIRAGQPSDLDPIVRCHISVWRATYSHMVEPELAAKLTDYGRRAARWAELLGEQGAKRQVIVAEAKAGIVGFGVFGEGAPEIFPEAGEIKTLYVAVDHHGRGVGKRLFRNMAKGLEGLGHAAVGLGVVRGNTPAIAFYEKLGGRHAGEFTDPGPLWRSDNLIYRWDDLRAVIARCTP